MIKFNYGNTNYLHVKNKIFSFKTSLANFSMKSVKKIKKAPILTFFREWVSFSVISNEISTKFKKSLDPLEVMSLIMIYYKFGDEFYWKDFYDVLYEIKFQREYCPSEQEISVHKVIVSRTLKRLVDSKHLINTNPEDIRFKRYKITEMTKEIILKIESKYNSSFDK